MVSLFPNHDSLIKIAYFAMTLSGLLNPEDKLLGTIMMAYQWISVSASSFFTITELIVGSREIADMVQTLSAGIISVLDATKLILFVSRRKQIRHLFNRLEDKRLTVLGNEEYSDYINKTEIFGRKLTKIIFYTFIGLPIPLFILNTLSFYLSNFKRKQLLVKIWTGWSREKPLAHILTNGLITIVTISVILVTVGFYFMEITFALYISVFIKILRNKLINKGINNKEVYDDHKVIIQLINDYNAILSGQIYLETVITPIVPCGYALSVIRALQRREIGLVLDNSAKALRCLMPAIVSCTCGQLVLDEMEKLHEATFMNNWYEEGTKARKNLQTLMIRTTNPSSIHYRLFITFNHIYLSAVLQRIYSYFMMMVNLAEV